MPTQYLIQSDGGFLLLVPGPGDLIISTRNLLIPDPRLITFHQWASTVIADNRIGPLPADEADWRDWADGVRQVTVNAPSTIGFNHWRDWALAWLGST